MLRILSIAARAASLTYQTLATGVMIGALVSGVVTHLRNRR